MAANVPPQGNVPPQVGQAGAGPAPVFALTAAALMGNAAFIDYNTKEGSKAYERAIEPLNPPYDGSTKGLQMFIHQIKRKATICGWTNSILTIPVGQQQYRYSRSMVKLQCKISQTTRRDRKSVV